MILQFQRESYPNIKLIHKMLTGSLLSIIGVNNHWELISLYLRKHSYSVISLTFTKSGNSEDISLCKFYYFNHLQVVCPIYYV